MKCPDFVKKERIRRVKGELNELIRYITILWFTGTRRIEGQLESTRSVDFDSDLDVDFDLDLTLIKVDPLMLIKYGMGSKG